ncbi:MAG: cupin domain-containing protein [Cyclobacteriaceae bacterium]
MAFIEIETIEQREILPGYTVRFVHTDSMTIAYWDAKAGSPLPEHSHHHEQVATVVEGTYELTVDGETRKLQAGEIAVIPSNVPHSGVAITDCKLMDVFCPVREDYLG